MIPLADNIVVSDKERLLSYGYRPQHIMELPDGSAILDLDAIRMDFGFNLSIEKN